MRWPDPVRHKITVSDEAKDLITMLCQKDRKQRLGQKNDVDDVLGHKFFEGMDFEKLLRREIPAEFIPQRDDSEHGVSNFDPEITQQNPKETVINPQQVEKISKHEDKFKDFGFSD